MAGSAIFRHGHTITDDGKIVFNDELLTWPDADSRAGFRLDRRKAWAFVDGELADCVRWTQGCSGCYGGVTVRGIGCSECGYRGIVRLAAWVPYSSSRGEA